MELKKLCFALADDPGFCVAAKLCSSVAFLSQKLLFKVKGGRFRCARILKQRKPFDLHKLSTWTARKPWAWQVKLSSN